MVGIRFGGGRDELLTFMQYLGVITPPYSSLKANKSFLFKYVSQPPESVHLASQAFFRSTWLLPSVAFHLRNEQADNISRSNWPIALAVSAFTDIYCLQKHGHNCFEQWESKNRGRDHLALELYSDICFQISKLSDLGHHPSRIICSMSLFWWFPILCKNLFHLL